MLHELGVAAKLCFSVWFWLSIWYSYVADLFCQRFIMQCSTLHYWISLVVVASLTDCCLLVQSVTSSVLVNCWIVNVILLICYLASTASLLSVHEHDLRTHRLLHSHYIIICPIRVWFFKHYWPTHHQHNVGREWLRTCLFLWFLATS